MNRNQKNKAGFILSAELVMISTILVIGLLVGMVAMRNQLLAEMKDTAEAIGALNQSYTFTGWQQLDGLGANMAQTAGSEWLDSIDIVLHADTVLLNAPAALPFPTSEAALP